MPPYPLTAAAIVLLIDDDPVTRDLLGAGLRRFGLIVFTAGGEWDGADLARAVRPGVILLEFGRRSYEGSFSVGRRVKFAAGLLAEVPLIVYAARAEETAWDGEAWEAAPGEYVILPENHSDLAGLLQGLMAAA